MRSVLEARLGTSVSPRKASEDCVALPPIFLLKYPRCALPEPFIHPKIVMKTIPIYLCRLVSLLGLVCSGFCFWYVASMGSKILGSPPRKGVPDHFVEWYVGLSAIAVLIALCVFVGSVELARLRLRGVQLLTLSSFLPMPLLMVVGGWWVSPMGKSIAAATGVGLGGLVPMMITLLPLWAGLLWSKVFRPTSTLVIIH